MTKQIIINGIDVSECKWLIRFGLSSFKMIDCVRKERGKINQCGINNHLYGQEFCCEDNPDCYYKQLKRLEQENKELRQVRKNSPDIQEPYIYLYRQIKKQCHKLKQENKDAERIKYKQALEKIRDILCNGRTFYEGYFDNPNLSRMDEAIIVINEVLK